MIITVAGGKGGTGKSMVATSLAKEYAKKKTVFLVDVDVECPNDHLLLDIERVNKKTIRQVIPVLDKDACRRCGKCAAVCKQSAIAYVKGKYPAFVKDACIGCKACMLACPFGAIREGEKEIGSIYEGNSGSIQFISGELRLGQPSSGEVVTAVRKYAEQLSFLQKPEIIVIDAAAGVGCPVIASLVGSDYMVAVTEPTPSALHDLKRSVYLSRHFHIPCGIVINKFDLENEFCKKIEEFASVEKMPVIGYIPYHRNFIEAALKMRAASELFPQYAIIFEQVINNIKSKNVICSSKPKIDEFR